MSGHCSNVQFVFKKTFSFFIPKSSNNIMQQLSWSVSPEPKHIVMNDSSRF